MKRIFISYRRAESVDIAGRIYDRLMGYFGPNRVFIDVDALLAGVDYSSQIARMLDQCDVVLVIIGEQWLTIADESGRRRLDDPDDLLRREVMTALPKKDMAVVPVLVHDALLPQETELPAELADLAARPPIEVRSGIRFNADVSNLIGQLETTYGVQHPDRRLPWEPAIVVGGVLMMVVAALFCLTYFDATQFVRAHSSEIFKEENAVAATESTVDHSSSGLRKQMWNLFFASVLPAGLGAFVIVFGLRSCCGKKDRDRETAHFLYGLGRRPAHQSGKAVLCFALGLASSGWGWITGIPAILMGIFAYWDIRRKHGWMRGRLMIVQGVILAVAGGCLQTYVLGGYVQDYYWLVHMENAQKRREAGNPARSLAELQAALDWRPNYPATYYLRAEINAQDGRHSLAIADLTQAIGRIRKRLENVTYLYAPERQWLKRSLERRAAAYEAIGEKEKAKQDTEESQQLYDRPESKGPLPDPDKSAPKPAPVSAA
jgi:hypothetical protein